MMAILNREWFNRLYFYWISKVYEADPELAKKLDVEVIGGLGRKMATEINKELRLDNSFTTKKILERICDALKQSHWFQETVRIIEKSNYEYILNVCNCSFQYHWIKKFGHPLNCRPSHKRFLEEFCKVFSPYVRVECIKSPQQNTDSQTCTWKLSMEKK